MCRKIHNYKVFYNPKTGERIFDKNDEIDDFDTYPFDGLWAIKNFEYVIDSHGEYIGRMRDNTFIPIGEIK